MSGTGKQGGQFSLTIQKVFITGATGFIGKHLVELLAREGYSIGALVRSPGTLYGSENNPNITTFPGDIRNYEDLKDAFSRFQPDAVIHLVTYYAVMHRADEIGVMLDTNVKGTVNLLEAARESGIKLFINTSTCAVYRQKQQRLSEADAVLPQNLYAVTKLQAEEACTFYADAFHLPCVTLRLFPPYGPGDRERRLIPYVIGSLLKGPPPGLTSGKQEWDFVYVTDIASAFLAALRSYPFSTDHEIINIGTGEPLSVRSVGEKIREGLGSGTDLAWGSVEHRMNEVWYNSADIGKARTVLGWAPRTGIDEGLRKTISWFRDYYGKSP